MSGTEPQPRPLPPAPHPLSRCPPPQSSIALLFLSLTPSSTHQEVPRVSAASAEGRPLPLSPWLLQSLALGPLSSARPRPAAPLAWTAAGAWSFAVTLCPFATRGQDGPSLLTALRAPGVLGCGLGPAQQAHLAGARLHLGPLFPSPCASPASGLLHWLFPLAQCCSLRCCRAGALYPLGVRCLFGRVSDPRAQAP